MKIMNNGILYYYQVKPTIATENVILIIIKLFKKMIIIVYF